MAPETRLISLRREEENSIGQANSAESAQVRLSAGLDEIKEQLKAEKQVYLTNALTDLAAIEGETSELAARIPALESRVARTSVRSPVDGVINRLNYTTANAYVSTGDTLLEIVPTGSDLIVETKIDPKDIGEIVTGQEVKISLTAYDPSRYGRIDGSVKSISADALIDKTSGAQFYLVDVTLAGTLYEEDGSEVDFYRVWLHQLMFYQAKELYLTIFGNQLQEPKIKPYAINLGIVFALLGQRGIYYASFRQN